MDRNLYISLFVQNLEKLAGKAFIVPNPAAVAPMLQALLKDQRAVASNAPFLAACGVTGLAQVESGFTEPEALRQACATAGVGITSADYALAATGSLVMLASPQEARLISLLPPVHVAVFPKSRILGNLDELLARIPQPAEQTSSMVLITGPSRTADIEQILIRGVHGPGEVYAVIVEEENS
ncbi:MAG: lactate utilization protein [Acidobacteriia bacterium]|nr:lactate utilization protein [Terriglobia bacterium]